MIEEIFFSGVKYISASDAAELYGFTRDYIGRLCREEKVRGKRVGKNWFVDQESFRVFIVDQEFKKSRSHQALSKKRRLEYHNEYPVLSSREADLGTVDADLFAQGEEKEIQENGHILVNPIQDKGTVPAADVGAFVPASKSGILIPSHELVVPKTTSDVSISMKKSNVVLANAEAYFAKQEVRGHALKKDTPHYVPTYLLSPATLLLHKTLALVFAFMLTFGTYTAMHPQYALRAEQSIHEELASVSGSYQKFATSIVPAQIVAAASLSSATLLESVSSTLSSLAQGFSSNVDRFIYAIMFPSGATDSVARVDPSMGRVSINIAPYQGANQPTAAKATQPLSVVAKPKTTPAAPVRTPSTNPQSSQSATTAGTAGQTIVNNNTYPVIERIVERQTLASAGGLTEAILNDRLQILDNKLMAQILSHSSANSTAIAQNYVVTAQSNAIHNLTNVTIGNPTISGGSISGTSVAATSLSISGNATTTSGGGFDISSGCFSIDGTCITGGSGSWPFDTDTNFAASVQSTSTPLWLKNAVFASSTSQFVNASSSQQTIAGTLWLPAINSAILATDGNGLVSATTSIGANYITGTLGTINGTTFTRGGSITVAAASSTLLSDNNTFSGIQAFSFASSTDLIVSGMATTSNLAVSNLTSGRVPFVASGGKLVDSSNMTFDGSVFSVNGVIQSTTGIFRGDDQYHQIILHNGGNNSDYFEWGDTLAAGGGHRFFTGGASQTLRMQIADDGTYIQGPLGVGTTSPWARLSILAANNSSAPQFVVGSSTATSILVAATGNVGIGTTSPGSLLSVAGTGYFSGALSVSGLADFLNSSTTLATLSGTGTWFSGLTNSLLSTDQNGKLSATTTIGSNLLTVPANSLLAGNASGQIIASTTIGWNLIKGPASSIFAFDASGNPTATTSIGTNYITGALGTINGTTFTRGDSITVAAASSTLLIDNNTFSGANIFSSPLSLSATTGTTTIATGQGFTIGGSQFVLQQGSGRVGVGTTSPRADLHVGGGGQIMVQNGNTLQDRGGDFWMTSNAYFDGTDWRRQDASKTAFGLDLRGNSNLPNEAEQGAALWVAQSGTNPISSTFGTTGGWEIGWAVTATRNLVVGGMGLELDGSGLSPYGRLVHNNGLSTVNTGIAQNIYADFSGRDASAQPSWFAGFVDDAFKIRRLAGSDTITSNNFSSLLSVNASGTLAVTGNVGIGTTSPLTALSIVGSGNSGINIGGFFGSGYGAISLNGTADGTNYNLLSGNSVTDNSLYLNRASGGAIHFREANGTDQMTILTGGNVGIGTTTPYSKLTTWGTGSLFEAVTNSSSTVFSIGQNGATTTSFAISNLASALLSTNANGSVVATTSIGVNYLSGILGIANGGTATGTQVTNGINYFDGTRITSNNLFTYDGTTTVLTANSANTSGNPKAFTVGGTVSTGSTGDYAGIAVNPVYTASSGNTLGTLYGLQSNPRNTGSGTISGLYSIYSIPQNTSNGIVTSMTGILLQPQNTDAGTTTSMQGVNSQPLNNGTGTTTTMYGLLSQPRASAGSVTTMYGAYLDCGASGASATVTTCYTLRLGTPVLTGTISTVYGLYQDYASAINYFGGKVGIGTTTPFWNLTVASSTGPQLALLDTTSSSFAWTLRSKNNNLYFATSTATATSTTAALSFDGTTGAAIFGSLSTSTFSGGLQVPTFNATGLSTLATTLLTNGTSTNFFSTTASSTNLFSQTASIGTLNLPSITHSLLSTNSTGQVVATTTIGSNLLVVPSNSILAGNSSGALIASTTIGWNLLKGPASSLFAFDSSGNPTATTSIGVNYLTGILPIANGGTATSTQVTNGINYFNGTRITSDSLFNYDGTNLGFGTTTPARYVGVTNRIIDMSLVTGTVGVVLHSNGQEQSWLNNNGAGMFFDVSGAASPANNFISFRTQKAASSFSSGTLSSNLYITGTGEVGVGTTLPTTPLTVSTSTALANVGVNNLISFGMPTNSGVSFPQYATLAVGTYAAHTPTAPKTRMDLLLKSTSNANLFGDVTVQTWLDNGNVGIGTTSPFSKLTTWGTGSLFEAVTNSSSTVFSIGQNGATTTSFAISNLASALLSTNANGSVVATTTIGWNLIKGPASSIFAFDASGNPTATTSIGVNYLSGILGIANGGTATGTQVTNGVNYFDGTRITSGTSLTFDGTTLGTPLFNSTQTSGTSTIASGQGFTIGSTQLVLQQGSGNVGIGATALGTSRLRVSSNGSFNDKVLEVTAAGVAGGQTGPFYGGYFNVVSNNNSTAGYGLYAQALLGGGGNKYGVYGSAQVSSSNVYSYGLYGLGSYNSGATGGAGIGLYADATTTGSSMLATTYGAYITNSTSFGANAYGAYINAGAGATNVIPLAVASAGVEAFRVASTGNVGIGTTSPQEKLSIQGGNLFQTGGARNQIYTPATLGGVDLGIGVGQSLIGGGQNISVVGNTMYLVNASTTAGTDCSTSDQSSCGFRIYDISTSTPHFLGGVSFNYANSHANSIAVAGQYAYLSLSIGSGTCNATTPTGCEFRIYDVSNPSSPTFKGGLDFAATGETIVVSGHYAYMTLVSVSGNDFLVIDIADPTNPVIVGGLDLGTTGTGLRVQGNYAYITTATVAGNDLVVADISNPVAPVVVGGMDLGTNGRSVYVSGNYAYVGKDNGGITGEFMIYDISNPAAIATTTELNLGVAPQSIFVSGRYAYLGLSNIAGTCSSTTITGCDFRVYDVSDPYNITPVGGVDFTANVQGVFVAGRRAFVGLASASGNDLVVLDITGAEVQSLLAHSLEAGNLNLRNDLVSNGHIFADTINAGNGGIYSTGGIFSYVASSTAANPVAGAFMGGSVGIGTSTPWARLSILAVDNSAAPQFIVASSTATSLIVTNAGNVGVGTTSPWRSFSVVGTVAFNGLTTGSSVGNAICLTAAKDVIDSGTTACTSSSLRFKENVETLPQHFALDTLDQLRVVSFDYKEGYYSPEDRARSYGLIAEEVQQIDPALVDFGYDGLAQSLKFEKLTGLTIQGIQELNLNLETIASTTASSTPQSRSFATSFFGNVFSRLTQWFADTANGIGKFFAKEVHTDTLCVSDSSGETCITKAQLDALLAGAASAQGAPASQGGGSSGGGGSSAPAPADEPTPVPDTSFDAAQDEEAPMITINGNNPATIEVGSTYADLGASVTDNVDNNLGIKASVDGGAEIELGTITIDTSAAGTHTIEYRATDQAGNTGTATRTVTVESTVSADSGEASPPPAAAPATEPDPVAPTP